MIFYLFILFIDDELHVAGVLRPVSHRPLQWPEVGVIDVNVVLAQPREGLFFSEAAAAVFEGRKDRRWDVVVVGLLVGVAADPASQQFSCLVFKNAGLSSVVRIFYCDCSLIAKKIQMCVGSSLHRH